MKHRNKTDDQMNNEQSRKRARFTITRQFALIFAGLMVGTIVFLILINNTFLERFYIRKKEDTLKNAFIKVEEASEDGKLQDEDFVSEIENICRVNNMDLIIVDVDSRIHLYIGKDQEGITLELWDKVFLNQSPKKEELIEQGEKYQLLKSVDVRTGVEYLEIWGFLSNDDLFLMRIAVESIVEAVEITNRFMTVIGLFTILISVIVIVIVTRKISKPILELADISDRMRNLDFNARYVGKQRNEIGVLGDNINKLSGALEKTISELKSANVELQKDIEKKEQIEVMRSEFISNVSHELKTPIALIQGYAEGLTEGISDDKESRDYYCSVISDEVARMNSMVQQLLTLNELEFGNKQITMERFDIVTMIKNRLQAAEIMTKSSGIELIFPVIEPIYVWSNEFRTEEVFTNYLSNAINHCEGEKKIQVDIKTGEKSGDIRVTVFNTGEPIPEESMEHLFEKFYKVDKARTRAYGGSGIGLSIVKAIQDSVNKPYGAANKENGVEFWFDIEKA